MHAPELDPSTLLSLPEMAQMAGLSASTLRAYVTREQNDVPAPQLRQGTRSFWSAPVVREWIEQRERQPEALAERVSGSPRGQEFTLPVGIVSLWERATETVAARLQTVGRRRLGRRLDDATIDALSKDVAWFTVASPDTFTTILPVDRLAAVIARAVRCDIADEVRLQKETQGDAEFLVIDPPTAVMLDWLIRHHPIQAARCLQSAVGDCERDFEFSRKTLQRAIIRGLHNGVARDIDPAVIDFVKATLNGE